MGLPVAAGAEGLVVPIARNPGTRDDGSVAFDTDLAGADAARTGLGRPLLIGGALTSAALSIAGAAYVAWRLNRPPASAMVRAARAVARTRPV